MIGLWFLFVAFTLAEHGAQCSTFQNYITQSAQGEERVHQLSTPEAPSKLELVFAGQRKVAIKVTDPVLWNGIPFGYRVKWLSKGRPDESGEDVFQIPSSRENDTLNITLNLEPGESYQIFVFAVNTDHTKATYEGPAATADICTAPKEPTDAFARLIAPGRIVVGWKSRGAALYFRIITEYSSYARNTLIIDSQTYEAAEHRVTIDLYPSMPTTNNFVDEQPVTPEGLNRNEVLIEACSVTEFCADITTRVIGTYLGPPEVSIIRAYSVSSTSFKVDWWLRGKIEALHDGFNVHYCDLALRCRSIITNKGSLVASNLSPGTTYDIEVRARHRNRNGGIMLGRAARRRLTTWTQVPRKPILTGMNAESDYAVASWTFYKSMLAYVQISKKDGVWTNCSSKYNCIVDFISGHPRNLKPGFITLTNLVPYTNYSFSVRGCNENGCGDHDTLQILTNLSEPSEPLNLNVTSETDGIVKIVWDPPAEPNGPLNGYIVSWKCSPAETFTSITNETMATIEGISEEGGGCSISVAGFNFDERENMLLGRSQEVTFP